MVTSDEEHEMKDLMAKIAKQITIAFTLFSITSISHAETIVNRVLDVVHIEEQKDCAQVQVGFTTPVLYTKHSANVPGTELLVFFKHKAGDVLESSTLFGRESVSFPPKTSAYLTDIVYEEDDNGIYFLRVNFSRTVHVNVVQGSDFRSLNIIVAPSKSSLNNNSCRFR